MIHKFPVLKSEIIKVLKENPTNIKEPVYLLDGFIMAKFKPVLNGKYQVGGPTVPMVMLIGQESGTVYHFSLRALLPWLEMD